MSYNPIRFLQRQPKKRLTTFAIILAVLMLILWLLPRYLQGPYLPSLTTGRAPDGNWNISTWPSGNNSMVGTSPNTLSNVWFTGHNGTISSVYFPSPDMPNSTTLEFLVGDSSHTWLDEEQFATTSQTELYDPHSLAWVTTNTAKSGLYQIKKIIYTDPFQDALIQKVTFTALKGTLADYQLYAYYDPTMHNGGDKNSGFTAVYNELTMLLSTDTSGDYASALGATLPFEHGMTSSGFMKFNDGLIDLKGSVNCGTAKCPDYTMNFGYDNVQRGNIAQLGQFDLTNDGENNLTTSTNISFKLALGFGQSNYATDVSGVEYAERTLSSVLNDTSDTLKTYVSLWNTFDNNLKSSPNVGTTPEARQINQNMYYLSANILKAGQDKRTGAFVSGFGNPWGESKGDNDPNPNQTISLRDMFQILSTMVILGDTSDPERALQWIFQQQKQGDGRILATTILNAEVTSNEYAPDVQAYPLILALRLGLTDSLTYSQQIKPIADYLIKQGPASPQNRWGEPVSGYSPSLIATQISALVSASEIARLNKDTDNQKRYLDTADDYQKHLLQWTYTASSPTYPTPHFEAMDTDGNPNTGTRVTLPNNAGNYDDRDILDLGFLDLVRQGIFSPTSPEILNSLRLSEIELSQTLNQQQYWYRYSHDGYGEHADGSSYNGSGTGRLWPLLSAQRGFYAILNQQDPMPYLNAMLSTANSSGLFPEQVWDITAPNDAIPTQATKSIAPQMRTSAEFLLLLTSIAQQKVVDMVPLVYDRYIAHPQNTSSDSQETKDTSEGSE